MVCCPCFVIPFVLWFFNKYIQPLIVKFWPWKSQASVDSGTESDGVQEYENFKLDQDGKTNKMKNGLSTNVHSETVGECDKKTN
ncbi:hypothetical protein DPMN_141842 [Dreissena polymorpha]|uniref:Uncharacterized protein n=1 Tax=Dreissena polymorpha TaxID=45954 RepID=A0A9D4GDE9_DREPO|nr:hypothetical protein DPMN_141842 [Dreissena polymorpha]